MNCPYCGEEMEKGRMDIYSNLNPIMATTIKFVSNIKEEEITAKEITNNEGWHCLNCNKILGVFQSEH